MPARRRRGYSREFRPDLENTRFLYNICANIVRGSNSCRWFSIGPTRRKLRRPPRRRRGSRRHLARSPRALPPTPQRRQVAPMRPQSLAVRSGRVQSSPGTWTMSVEPVAVCPKRSCTCGGVCNARPTIRMWKPSPRGPQGTVRQQRRAAKEGEKTVNPLKCHRTTGGPVRCETASGFQVARTATPHSLLPLSVILVANPYPIPCSRSLALTSNTHLTVNRPEPFVDIHCHVLPDLDDGASSWDEALAMAEMRWRTGLRRSSPRPTNWAATRRTRARQSARRPRSFNVSGAAACTLAGASGRRRAD